MIGGASAKAELARQIQQLIAYYYDQFMRQGVMLLVLWAIWAWVQWGVRHPILWRGVQPVDLFGAFWLALMEGWTLGRWAYWWQYLKQLERDSK